MTNTRTIERNCLTCHQPFQAPVKEVNRGNGKYCSISCIDRRRPKKDRVPNAICAYCSKEFWCRHKDGIGSKSGLRFCCREHKDLAQRIGGLEAIQPDHYRGNTECVDYRLRALRLLPNKCNRCGFDEKPIWVVHHKDRDRTNNDISNLEILCPNCHAIEHWFPDAK